MSGGLDKDEYQTLIDVARQKSSESREKLTKIISDLFHERGESLSAPERALITDILHKLVRDVELPVRQMLAEKLARTSHAPRDLICYLANEQIEVAHPLLSHSSILLDEDLIEIIRHRTMQHQLSIALRQGISEDVSDALITAGHTDVVIALLENRSAKIHPTNMQTLIDQAKEYDPYQEPILKREDLEPALAKKLYWWVSAALRRHILEHYPIDPLDLEDQLESTVQDLIERSRKGQGDEAEAQKLAAKLAESGALNATLLMQILRKGEVLFFEVLFAHMAEIRISLLRRLLYEPGGEGLAIVAKALKIEKPSFASLFLLSRRVRPDKQPVDPMELSRVLAFFDDLTEEAAGKMVKRWRRDPQFLEAMWRVERQRFGKE